MIRKLVAAALVLLTCALGGGAGAQATTRSRPTVYRIDARHESRTGVWSGWAPLPPQLPGSPTLKLVRAAETETALLVSTGQSNVHVIVTIYTPDNAAVGGWGAGLAVAQQYRVGAPQSDENSLADVGRKPLAGGQS
jgi:hypothetical protein